MGCGSGKEDTKGEAKKAPPPPEKKKSHDHQPAPKPKTAEIVQQQKKSDTMADKVGPFTRGKPSSVAYEQVLQTLKTTFQDTNFPPEPISISIVPSTFALADESVWKDPKEFLEGEVQVFQGKIEPNDIKQGQLGDCYFLSALSGLAEYPGLIEKLFETKQYQENGLYCVWLCHDGQFQQVLLDHHIPCSKESGKPVFSHSNGGELWVLLLEKAYSKIYGAYDKIEQGLYGQALRDLTGAPYEYHIVNDDEPDTQKYWEFIINGNSKNFLLGASSTSNAKGKEQENKEGIISDHCYAILDAKDVTGSDGQEERIIQLRNPWGHNEWKGDWSDDSYKWTPELREQLKVTKADDGLFWIGVSDCMKQFKQICVSKVNSEYIYSGVDISDDIGTQITQKAIRFEIDTYSHAYFSLSQRDKRNYAKTGKQYEYSYAKLLVARYDPATEEVFWHYGGVADCDRDTQLEVQLDPGTYFVYFEVHWAQQLTRHLVLSAYSELPIAFPDNFIQTAIIEQLVTNALKKFSERNDPTQTVETYEEGIVRYSEVVGGFLYFYYVNPSAASTLTETVKLVTRENLSICYPFENSDEYKVTVGPNSDTLVRFSIDGGQKGASSYSTSYSYTVTRQYDRQELYQLAINSPTSVEERLSEDKPTGIVINTYQFGEGLVLLYQNKSYQVYEETLQLTLQNLFIEADQGQQQPDPSAITISMRPGEEYFLVLKVVDATQGTSYACSFSFSLSEP